MAERKDVSVDLLSILIGASTQIDRQETLANTLMVLEFLGMPQDRAEEIGGHLLEAIDRLAAIDLILSNNI